MLSLYLTLLLMITESNIIFLTFGKNSANIKDSSWELSTTLNSLIVILQRKVSISASMPGNMSMISSLTSFQFHHCSELSEHAVLSSKTIRMSLLFVNLSLLRLLEPHAILQVKQDQKWKNSPIIILMPFYRKEISGLLKTIQKKIKRNTLKLWEKFKTKLTLKNVNKF